MQQLKESSDLESVPATPVTANKAGARLRYFLQTRGLRQVQLQRLGLNTASISQYIKGRVTIPPYVCALLRLAYSLNPDWLKQGLGTMLICHEQEAQVQQRELKAEYLPALSMPKQVDVKQRAEMMAAQGRRLRTMLMELKIRQRALAQFGISSSMFSQYLSARVRIPSYIAALLALAYRLNPRWLRSGTGVMFLPAAQLFTAQSQTSASQVSQDARQTSAANPSVTTFSPTHDDRHKLQRVGTGVTQTAQQAELQPVRHLGVVAAGVPIPMPDDWDGEYSWVSARLLNQHRVDDYYTLSVRGESMIEAGIRDGDKVIIHHQDTAEHGQLAIVSLDGEATLKQLFFRETQAGRHVELRPCNNNLSSVLLDPTEFRDVKVHGILVGLLR